MGAILLASLIATIYIFGAIGPTAIFAGVARTGVGGLGLLCG